MIVEPDKSYSIRNIITFETAPFLVKEIISYKDGYVVYGILQQHGIFVFRGPRTIKARESCFGWIPNEDKMNVMKVNTLLEGLPLCILDLESGITLHGQTVVPLENRGFPILNSGRHTKLIPPLKVARRDDMLKRGCDIIDFYHNWKLKNRII